MTPAEASKYAELSKGNASRYAKPTCCTCRGAGHYRIATGINEKGIRTPLKKPIAFGEAKVCPCAVRRHDKAIRKAAQAVAQVAP